MVVRVCYGLLTYHGHAVCVHRHEHKPNPLKHTLYNAQSVATSSSADRAASSADVSSQNHGGNSWEGSWNQPAMAHRLDGG